MNAALLVVGHGSRDREGIEEFLELGRLVAARRPGQATGFAFLEFARPTIEQAIDQLVASGAERIICQPGMLFAAAHVKNDVPSQVQAAIGRWPGVEFRMGQALDLHPKLLELCRVRWEETLCAHSPYAAADTCLLVVGRGASDPGANASVAKITRSLWEGYGVGWAATCYSGVAVPLGPEALEIAGQRGLRRIVVQPYFLFTGALVKKIQRWTREYSQRHPELEVFVTSHLGVHPLLVDVFEERAHEAAYGNPNMNCQLLAL
ncbi:MAG: sirohydrochlorin chelatase [Planctomycetes bacterium]|nr:sirohydrochlorin chelatase [Planctomycetota bacterium]